MSVSYDKDERDSSANYTPSPIRGSAEQEQGLLGDWEEAKDEYEKALPNRQRRWSFAVSATVAIALVGFLLVGILVAVGMSHVSNGSSGQETTVRSDDYILDPLWDYQAPPQRRNFFWKVEDKMHNPDGIYRPMMIVENQFPGPLIEINEGDTIVVHIENRAVNATSIHWHGIFQRGTPHMDGTVGVSQCPIPPGGKFTYEFTVSGQSGTYWWHAHHGVQSSDGVHGPLIVHGRDEKTLQNIEYATDRVILVSDHYHDLSSALLWQYLKPDMENAEPVPDGALINGRSKKNCEDYPHRQCDNSSFHVGNITFDFAPEQDHRLRFINVGTFAEFQLQIDEHELAVVEVDGTDVVPINYHRLNISPAQRYSAVIKTGVDSADTFWLRARMVTKCFTNPPRNLQSEVRGIVRYTRDVTDSAKTPTSVDWEEKLDLECKDMNASELLPAKVISAPKTADALFYLRSNFEIGAYRLSRGFFNSSSWRPDIRSPSLQRAIEGLATKNSTFTPAEVSRPGNGAAFVNDAAFEIDRELVIQTTGTQTIDILVSNFDDGNHPLHLHGYKYFVLAQGHGYPPLTHIGADIGPETLAPLYDSLDLLNPLRRDTASVEGFGWILLRLVADNPGAWAFHCHISWHSEAGLLMQFLTRTDELADLEIPSTSLHLCAAEGLERGMAPGDAAYHDLAK